MNDNVGHNWVSESVRKVQTERVTELQCVRQDHTPFSV